MVCYVVFFKADDAKQISLLGVLRYSVVS